MPWRRLSHWLCDEPVSGLYEALLPDEVLGQIEEEDARVVARALRGVGQSAGFIARWQHVRSEQGLAAARHRRRSAARLHPTEAKAMLRPVLLRLWPSGRAGRRRRRPRTRWRSMFMICRLRILGCRV